MALTMPGPMPVTPDTPSQTKPNQTKPNQIATMPHPATEGGACIEPSGANLNLWNIGTPNSQFVSIWVGEVESPPSREREYFSADTGARRNKFTLRLFEIS